MSPPPASISLLIPCYNAAPFLPRLLASVRALTRPFTNILCYDDGSTDDTVGVAHALGLDIMTGQPNRGVAHARNRLAASADTDWIHFHDADDIIAPDFLARLSEFCDERHDVVSCDSDWVKDDESRAVQIAWRYDPSALADNPHRTLLHSAMSFNSSIIRRQSWIKVGGCDESLAIWEDADVHVRMARAGARWHHVPEVLTYALRRPESFSHDYARGWRCRLQLLEQYARDPGADLVTDALAIEAERAAAELACLSASADAARAVALCRRLGGRPPTSRNPILRLLKRVVPAVTLLRWQHSWRRSHG